MFHSANLFGSVLFTFYIQGVLKFKKIIPAPKGYIRKAHVRADVGQTQTLVCDSTNDLSRV